jgi:hypothetical protein
MVLVSKYVINPISEFELVAEELLMSDCYEGAAHCLQIFLLLMVLISK